MKHYRVKQKGRPYYVRWITDPNQAIFTDIKDEALLFDKKTAKNLIKCLKLFTSWIEFELELA